jgi:phosphoribosyl 1,2-cyclic phosphate phosphodiesterase
MIRNERADARGDSMIVTFLGTSAANAYPEAFCSCANCEGARELGGPSLRKRSSVLIDADLLIDLGPDIMTSSQMHGCSLTNVRYCLQTHAHADHLDPSHFLSRSPGFGVVGAPELHFYASRGTLEKTAEVLERDCAPHGFLDPNSGDRLNMKVHCVAALQSFSVGPYEVVAFPANHDPEVEPLLYAIKKDGYSVFYGTDTATFPEDTWQAFHSHDLRFDLVILDHTYGPEDAASDHLSARQLIDHAARLREEGLLCDGGRVLATHIAHEGNPPHPELSSFASDHGYEVAFDGLVV